nr:AraC family transcriptional regulator [Hyphomonas sp. Mor2]
MQLTTYPTGRNHCALHAVHDVCDAEGYRERTSFLLECTPLLTSRNVGTFQANAWYSDKAIFLHNETDAFALKHTHRHVSESAHLILLRRMVSGHLWGRIGDISTTFAPGPIHVQDQEMQYEGIQDRTVFQSAFIFKSALGYHPSKHLRNGQINPSSVVGRCLMRAWDDLFTQLWANDSFIDAELLDRFLACAKVALGAPSEREDIRIHARNALFEVICGFIEQNLSDPELTVSRLLREFGVSRASLFRMFDEAGGVRSYIRRRRATRALLDVSVQPYRRGIINAVAEEWGFSSAPNFNRIIRDLYGYSPGAMFERSQRTVSELRPSILGGIVEQYAT